MRNSAGTGKTNKWPKNILNFIKDAPQKPFYLSQSKCSSHKFREDTANLEKVMIGYNETFDVFVAWNSAVRVSQYEYKEGYFDFSIVKKELETIKKLADFEIESVYISAGKYKEYGNVYEKVVVFSPKMFEYFFYNYEFLMRPNEEDKHYRLPAFDFTPSDKLNVIDKKIEKKK